MVVTQAVNGVPAESKTRNLAARFADYGESYLKFLTTPGLEPTNNLAEQAIRFVVIDRKVTQGSKSEKGQRWRERIWTLTATYQQRGLSLLGVIRGAESARFEGDLPPATASPCLIHRHRPYRCDRGARGAVKSYDSTSLAESAPGVDSPPPASPTPSAPPPSSTPERNRAGGGVAVHLMRDASLEIGNRPLATWGGTGRSIRDRSTTREPPKR